VSRYVDIVIDRSYAGVIKQPPERGIDENGLIDDARLLNEDMKIIENMSFYFFFSEITGLTIKRLGGV